MFFPFLVAWLGQAVVHDKRVLLRDILRARGPSNSGEVHAKRLRRSVVIARRDCTRTRPREVRAIANDIP